MAHVNKNRSVLRMLCWRRRELAIRVAAGEGYIFCTAPRVISFFQESLAMRTGWPLSLRFELPVHYLFRPEGELCAGLRARGALYHAPPRAVCGSLDYGIMDFTITWASGRPWRGGAPAACAPATWRYIFAYTPTQTHTHTHNTHAHTGSS